MKKIIFINTLFACAFISGSSAQSITPSIVNATGGTNMFTFYRFEWSFGEAAAIETLYAPTLYVTNGVLQPGTHNPGTNITTTQWDKEEIKVLPNPVRNVLEIDFFSKQLGKVKMEMLDASGRVLGTKQFDYYGIGKIEKWDMTPYPAAVYFLHITLAPTNNSIAKNGSFQIVKAN